MKEKELIPIEKKNIFTRFLEFLKRFCKKENATANIIESPDNSGSSLESLSSFEEYIKVDSNLLAINDLKLKLDSEAITIEDVPEDKIAGLIEKYDKENLELRKEILGLNNKLSN